MIFSKEITSFVDNLIHHHAEYDPLIAGYALSYNDLDKDDLSELASLILKKDHNYAAECTGPDNGLYFKKMLPALIDILHDDDLDNRHNIVDVWRDAVIAYQENTVKELLESRLDYFNQNRTSPTYNYYAGVTL